MDRRIRVALLAVAVALTALHCWRFRDFTVDDAAISFAYSQSFAHGDGLVGRPGGERVEGYSNFLWVLLVGLVVAVAGHVMVVAKVLGLVLACVITVSAAELSAALRQRRSALDALPALLCAAFLPIPYWSMSGLENPLLLALTLGCAIRLVREADDPTLRPLSALFAAGVALTRPDGLVVAAAAAAMQLLTRARLRRLPLWLAIAATPVAAHLLWRWRYYAYPWPNTYYVKVAFPFRAGELFDLHARGWAYLIAFFARYHFALCALLVPLAFVTRRPLRRLPLVALVAATLFFPIYARGDWMNEGRFAVGAVPLLFVLATDGLENLARLGERTRRRAVPPAIFAVGAAALVWSLVPNSLALSKRRVHNYPVPVEYVAERARHYHELARALEVAEPSVADGDAGGNLLYADMPLVDIGWLTDGTLAHWGRNPGFVREYLFGERRPTFLRLTGYWLGTHLQDLPEFAEYVPAPDEGEGIYVARSALTADGIDTRRPLAALGDGIALVGSDVGATEVRAWLLARVDHPRGPLALHTAAGEVPVVPGHGIYPPSLWRAGEVVVVRAPRPPGAALALCAGAACTPLADGKTGALPVTLPPRANQPTRALAGELLTRAERESAAGETWLAFADYAHALAADPSRSLARRRLEELRPSSRASYHPILRLRLGEAARAFQLAPDAAHLSTLVRLAIAADDPLPAVRAHLATSLELDAATAPLIAACYLSAGLSARRVERASSERAGRVVADGLVLDAVTARLASDGSLLLELVLRRSAASAADRILVGERTHVLSRPPSRWDDGERVHELVPLSAPAGSSTVRVGAARVAVEIAPFSSDFERATADGWSATGPAFEAPARTQAWREQLGVQGNGYVASKEWGRGELRSPTLAPGVAEVCWLSAGQPNTGVQLVNGAETTPLLPPRITPPTCARVPPSPATGWQLAIVDGNEQGGIAVDDVTCFAADGAPLPCAGGARATIVQ